MTHSTRRGFLKSAVSLPVVPSLAALSISTESFAQSKTSKQPEKTKSDSQAGQGLASLKGAFKPLAMTVADEFSLAPGFKWYPLVTRGDVINAEGDRFGDCCDFLHFVTGESTSHGFLWVNHEYIIDSLYYGKKIKPEAKTKAQVDEEMKLVGGSYVEIRKDPKQGNRWQLVKDSKKAFRLDAHSAIPMVGPAGGRTAYGTMGNCAGGKTPWGTVLTAEENVDSYFHTTEDGTYGWGRFYNRPLEDYGWVVEVNVANKSARKLTALGRFAHEGAEIKVARNGKVVAYMGDDSPFQCLYKFVSTHSFTGNPEKDKDLLVDGDLYVADLKKCKWVRLSPENPKLAAHASGKFRTTSDILKNTREAARIAGGTPLSRPERIAVHPKTGVVYVSLTNNSNAGDLYGSLLALKETDMDFSGSEFSYETFVVGGPQIGFACPDNIIFGPSDFMWVCSDVSGWSMGKGAYKSMPRNTMMRLEVDSQGHVFTRQLALGPVDAELTGPCFHPDGKTLFLSVQHPGENSFEDGNGYTSHWPKGRSEVPLSTVLIVEENGDKFA